ncbi:helix-turn-helix domain-containing protein [Roseburia hominis]
MAGKPSVKNRIVDAAWKLFYEKGYDDTTVEDIIKLSDTSKGSFYYYFGSKDALLDTLATILDEKYVEMEKELEKQPEMDSFDKLMYLNYHSHLFMETKIDMSLLASLYSTQLIAKGARNLLDQNRTYYKLVNRIVEEGQRRGQIGREKSVWEITRYYSICERALVSDWCLNRGEYSLAEYSREYMPILMEHFRVGKEA